VSRRLTVWGAAACAWGFLGGAQAMQAYLAVRARGLPTHAGLIVAGELTRNLIWALLTPAVWLLASYAASHVAPRRAVALHAAGAVAFAVTQASLLAAAGAAGLVDVAGADGTPFGARVGMALAASALFDVAIYGVVVGLHGALAAQRRVHARQLRTSQLETRLARTQLESLRTRLQPHFLFNTLNAISSLMTTDVPGSRRMLTELGDLLRQSLDPPAGQEVALREELAALDGYLAIEQARFRDRLRVEVAADADCLDARLPQLVLQPLAEQALRRGLVARRAPLTLRVTARRVGEVLQLAVGDDAPAAGDDGDLTDLRARLDALYEGRAAVARHARDGDGTVVELLIPLSGAAPTSTPAPA
jgi:hypothetical protein